MAEGPRIDEFAFVLLAGLVLIIILTLGWNTMNQSVVQVTPSEKTITVARGSFSTFNLHLNGTAKSVNLTSEGDIASWLDFDRNGFDIITSVDVGVTVTVPYNASLKYYSGRIKISFEGGESSIPITVNVSSVIPADNVRRVLGPEDFVVRYSVGTETVSEKKSFTVQKGLFTDNYKRFVGVLTDEQFSTVKGGFIDIIVDDTNFAENLIVEFNGEEVYNDKPDLGKLTINLDEAQIQKTNTVVIKAASPGWRFWRTNSYDINDAKFGIDYQGISFKDLSFSLTSTEVDNFKYGILSFRITDYNANLLNNMVIKINDQTLFRGVPTLNYFSKTFGTEISLRTDNTISFSLEKDAFYELADVTLKIAS